MSYFQSYPVVPYQFGGNDNAIAAVQNISAYADVIDKFKNSAQSYLLYDIIEGDRPDVVSYNIYGSDNYYWTFYLMNDNLRRQGWPLIYNEIVDQAKESYPHTTLVFRTDDNGVGHVGHSDPAQDLIRIFKVGSKLEGALSGATGTVVRKDLDLGQVIISGSAGVWQNGEAVYFNRIAEDPQSLLDPSFAAQYEGITIFENAKLKTSSLEYLSAHHYEDASGNWIDVNPNNEVQSSLITEKTHLDFIEDENSKLKRIKILKPSIIRQVTQTFSTVIGG